MGDIADAMLDGTMCEGCGEYLDGGSPGFPRYCSRSCARNRGAESGWVSTGREPPTSFKVSKRLDAAIAKIGFTIVQHDAYHFTARGKDNAHVADWWPHKNKFRMHGDSACRRGDENSFKAALAAINTGLPQVAGGGAKAKAAHQPGDTRPAGSTSSQSNEGPQT